MASNVSLPAGGTEAGRAQPQTTVEQAGGPFLRYTQPGRRQMFQTTAAFSSTVSQPLPGVSGYYQRLRLMVNATTGAGTTAVAAADAPWNVIQQVNLQDSFGTPLIVAPGFEALYLIPKLSSTFGIGPSSDPTSLPSYSAIATSGNFQFSTSLGFEFLKGYGVISGANASLQPRLILNVNASTAVYSTAPSTVPTGVNVNLDADFYWLPEGTGIEPPGLGTTQQWLYQPANPTIGSGAASRVALPRLGGYLSALILELRDSTSARVDAWPAPTSNTPSTAIQRLRTYVDGVPLLDTTFLEAEDDFFIQYNGTSRPAGVWAINRKNSLAQNDLGLLDTGELFLSTSPGTLVEIEGATWGTIANSPATLNVVLGQIIPTGTLVTGLSQA